VHAEPGAHAAPSVVQQVEELANNVHAAPLIKADAAIYLAAALQVIGDEAQAKVWIDRGLAWYEKSMSPAHARLRAVRWVPALTVLMPVSAR
jgi:hypothetical protein